MSHSTSISFDVMGKTDGHRLHSVHKICSGFLPNVDRQSLRGRFLDVSATCLQHLVSWGPHHGVQKFKEQMFFFVYINTLLLPHTVYIQNYGIILLL